MASYTTLPVPERIQHLKDDLLAAPSSVCFERARIVTRSYQQTEGEHPALRRAKALYAVFDQMPIFIRQGELAGGATGGQVGGARSLSRVQPEWPDAGQRPCGDLGLLAWPHAGR